MNLYDIMAEDKIIYATLESNGEISIKVMNHDSSQLEYMGRSHQFAWDSLVYFAQQVLNCDKRIQKQLENKG